MIADSGKSGGNLFSHSLSPVISNPRLLNESAAVFLISSGGAGLSFLVQLLLARSMGPEQFGVYGLAMSWVLAISLLASLGLDSAVMRFVAAYQSLQHSSALRGLIQLTGGIVLGTSLVGAAGLVLASHYISPRLSGSFLMAAILLPLLTLLQMNVKILLALRHPTCGTLVGQMLRYVLLVMLIVGFVYGLRLALNAQRAIFLASNAALVALLLSCYFVFVFLPTGVSSTHAEYHTREWFGVALPLLAVTAAEQLLSRGDILVLGAFRAGAEVGLYAAAAALASSMELITSATNCVVGPSFAGLHAQRKRGELQLLLTRASRIAFAAMALPGIALLFFGKDILLLFGKSFPQIAGVLSLLVLAQLVRAFTGSVGLLLSMTGAHSVFAKALMATGVINLGLDLKLIPRYGAMGAAVATLIGVVLRSAVLSAIAMVKLGTVPTAIAPILSRLVGIPRAAQEI